MTADLLTELRDAHAQAANRFDRRLYKPLLIDGEALGQVRLEHVAVLAAYPTIFAIAGDGIRLTPVLEQADQTVRNSVLAAVCAALRTKGLLPAWRDELINVWDLPQRSVRLQIERGAARFFGVVTQAVHLNGLVARDGHWSLWVARRSLAKAVDPGLRDNLVAGGIIAGADPAGTLLRECAEEAGMPAGLAARAAAAGEIQVCRDVPEGLHTERLMVFDLILDDTWQPVNQDGEVSEFTLMPVAAVLQSIARGEFTLDAGLVTLDSIARLPVQPAMPPAAMPAAQPPISTGHSG